LELLLALAVGWMPGLVVQGVFGPGNLTVNATILVASATSLVFYLVLSLRRFDQQAVGSL
jgi:hypothetical protein